MAHWFAGMVLHIMIIVLKIQPTVGYGSVISHTWERNIHHIWRQEKCCPTLEGETSPSPMMSQNVNTKQSREVPSSVHLYLFCTFLDKNEKNNQSPHWGRGREPHPRVQDLQHPQLDMPRPGLQILDTRMGFFRLSLNVVLGSINLTLYMVFPRYLIPHHAVEFKSINTDDRTYLLIKRGRRHLTATITRTKR